jgi:hypothetical protein
LNNYKLHFKLSKPSEKPKKNTALARLAPSVP